MKIINIIKYNFILINFSALCIASNYANFKLCVEATANAVCILDPGYWPVDSTNKITVTRSNVTLTGALTADDTTIYRYIPPSSPVLPFTMIEVRGAVSGVTIQNMTIHGNRYINVGGVLPLAALPPGDAQNWFDVNAGDSSNLKIDAAKFYHSPGHTVNGPYPPLTGRAGLIVRNSHFESGRITGVSASHDTTIENSFFYYYGTGAVQLRGNNNVVRNNVFNNNHREFIYNSSGGQLNSAPQVDTVFILNNSLDGGFEALGSWVNCGMEILGTTVAIWNNSVKNHSGGGIAVNWASGVDIRSIDPSNPSNPRLYIESNRLSGIAFNDAVGSSNIYMTDLVSRYNGQYGIHGNASSPIGGYLLWGTVCLSPNTLGRADSPISSSVGFPLLDNCPL